MKTPLILLLFFCLSCGVSTTQETENAIDQALTYLSQENCADAITILEKLGRKTSDAVYLATLASAYSCRADFNMVSFIADDVPLIDSANLMKSLTQLSLSPETTVDSDAFTDLQTSLGLLGTVSTQATRTTTFGPRKAGDLGIQLVVLSIVELGKFLYYYGNVSATGVKGGGSGASKCFMNYTYNKAQTVIASGTTGACNGNNKGHPDLTTIKRMCEGMMLVTNIIDTLPNIDLSSSTEFADLSAISSVVTDYKTQAITADPTLATILNTTSQSSCETLLASATELNNMQYLYALIFEVGLQ